MPQATPTPQCPRHRRAPISAAPAVGSAGTGSPSDAPTSHVDRGFPRQQQQQQQRRPPEPDAPEPPHGGERPLPQLSPLPERDFPLLRSRRKKKRKLERCGWGGGSLSPFSRSCRPTWLRPPPGARTGLRLVVGASGLLWGPTAAAAFAPSPSAAEAAARSGLAPAARPRPCPRRRSPAGATSALASRPERQPLLPSLARFPTFSRPNAVGTRAPAPRLPPLGQILLPQPPYLIRPDDPTCPRLQTQSQFVRRAAVNSKASYFRRTTTYSGTSKVHSPKKR